MGRRKCIVSTGIAVGTSAVVRYSVDVRYSDQRFHCTPAYSENFHTRFLPFPAIQTVLSVSECVCVWRKKPTSHCRVENVPLLL